MARELLSCPRRRRPRTQKKTLKPDVGNHPVITYATPEPGGLGCVISIEIGVIGTAYPAAVSQKVAKNLPVSFYSPTSGFNLAYNSWSTIDRTFIFHMCISCNKIFPLVHSNRDVEVWLSFKNFNLDHSFLKRGGRTSIYNMYIPCDETHQLVPSYLT